MSLADDVKAPIRHGEHFFIGGQWVQPSSGAMIKVTDSGTEELFFSVAETKFVIHEGRPAGYEDTVL